MAFVVIKRSCETQLITVINDFATNLNNGLQTDVILLDLTKAFDKVSHELLCGKLYNYGIRGNTLGWIQNFLKHRTQRVLVDSCTSAPSSVTSGVPQGTVLAPLLFLCYINDISHDIRSTVKLYADEILIYRPILTIEDCETLQSDLDRLQSWANKWKMCFNPKK